MTLTRMLAELALNTAPDDFPDSAWDAAETMTLDTLGCIIAGARQPGCCEVVELIRDFGGREDATVLCHGGKAPLPQAVFANSVMTHALDYDDVYVPASLHVTSVVFPTVLSTAEFVGASGKEFLTAFILGVEVSCRLGKACRSQRRGQGFLPTSTECIFGATAAVCRLLGLSAEQTVNAMGIAYAQASGNRQALYDMTLTKRLQPAFAARSAVWSALLAKKGLTGAYRALEGDAGFFKTYLKGDLPDADELAFNGVWQIERLRVKQHPSCGATHPAVEAAIALAEEHDLYTADIDRVELSWGGRKNNSMVGVRFELADQPQVRAQFSAPYCVAVALVHRSRHIKHFTDDAIRADKEVLAIADKVEMVDLETPPSPVPIPSDYNTYAALPHTVTVCLRDGTRRTKELAPAEIFPAAAPDREKVEAKFRECATFAEMPADRADRVALQATQLRDSNDLDAILSACR